MFKRKKVIELTPEDMERVYDLISLHKRGEFSSFFKINKQSRIIAIGGSCKAKDIKEQMNQLQEVLIK